MFYGIVIRMPYRETQQHHLPHIHVRYGGKKAVVAIGDGRVLEDNINSNKLKLVEAWRVLHRDELLANWELAREGGEVYKIEPLR
ncbi:MAG: DUF4160 domain-containing protein [Verrucomicrobiales bacterium]|jgi:hypothetical protein|nr:DUF4160 domain-containing protein [Verrucomicrobiales bacterium]